MPAPDAPAPDARLATVLAYAGGWASGATLFAIERDRPAVRFHAAQSLITFLSLTVLWVLCWGASFVALIFSADAFFALQRLAQAVLIVGLLVWISCLLLAFRGGDFRLPLAGTLAARLAASPSPGSEPLVVSPEPRDPNP